MKACIFCGRETENAQWVDGVYEPLCLTCEEELERMIEAAERLPALQDRDDSLAVGGGREGEGEETR